MNPSEMQRKTPPRRRKHRNQAPLTRRINQVVILEKQMKSPRTKKAELPTWAQLKKLTLLARKSLASTKVTQTSEKMLFAALMVVSMVVSLPMPAGAAAANYTYWAYVPFPPLIRAVTWMDNPIEVYVNNSVWVAGPTDDRCPAKPEEEGMMINISIRYRYPPICLGRAPGCLMPAIQNWLVEVPTLNPTSRFTYHMVSGMSLKPQVNYLQDFSYQRSLIFRPKGRPCPKEISIETKDLVWEECVADSAVILQNNTFGTVIDWAPRGQFYHDCTGQTQFCPNALVSPTVDSDLTKNLDKHRYKKFQSFYPWKWGEKGTSTPRPKIISPVFGPEHPELWRLTVATNRLRIWSGNQTIETRDYKTFYSINLNSSLTVPLLSCVKPPYMLVIGNVVIKPDSQTITCENCRLFTCIDSTFDWQHRILLVRAREGVWIPVSMDRPWEASPSIHILTEVLKGILNRSKRFIFTLIAVIMGLIAVTATAAVAGVALHSSVQTVSFVDNWQKNSTRLWNSQSGIDQKLANQINDLRQTVIWIGDRLMSLDHRFQLQCDWNTSDFCITPQVYNESRHHWDMVRRHLQGREDNLTLDISKLKEQIFEASQSHLNIVPGAEALDQVAKNLYGLNPTTWIQSIGNSTAVNFGIMCLCLIGLFLVCRTSRRILRQNRENEKALMTMVVLLKRKGGNVGKRKRDQPVTVSI
nr:endogenous retrovirus group K member 25 Env polyprotein-like [Symphalangus syndactylus]